ncbi:MAG: hydrolase 1, exosortase A system-associated [Hydrogenophaga sp.]
MTINERSVWLHGDGFNMLGIVSLPPAGQPVQSTGVVIVVGGAQYRAGSHRQFTQLARFLAEAGFPVLRFDLPGMGDSPGELPSFEDTAPHIAAAIDGFRLQHPGVERVVLLGLCDGAAASLLYVDATHDTRIAGLTLLNPWVRSAVSLAQARVKYYYWQRLREADFWRKLLRGGVGWGALQKFGHNVRSAQASGATDAGFQDRMARGWLGFGKPILLLLSERDLTAQEFLENANRSAAWAGWNSQASVLHHTLLQADHTCSSRVSAHQFEELTSHWLQLLS